MDEWAVIAKIAIQCIYVIILYFIKKWGMITNNIFWLCLTILIAV